MSLNRFRNQNYSKPLYDQRGDVSLPPRALYKPSRAAPGHEDDIISLTGSNSTPVSRNNSFTMKSLNPRSLSVRLKNRSSKSPSPSPSPREQNHSSTVNRSHIDQLPASGSAAGVGGARAEFVYKPIHRTDYTAVVAETATAQSRPSRYQYHHIASGRAGRYMEGQGGLPVTPHPRSRARAGQDGSDKRGCDLYNDLDMGYDTVSRPRGEHADMYSSAAEKQRRAARRLTTVMVPDAEDIYG
ncbi:hypothetical protein BDW62DRAFT_172640 [Aspergillus aurantiobrunneus]